MKGPHLQVEPAVDQVLLEEAQATPRSVEAVDSEAEALKKRKQQPQHSQTIFANGSFQLQQGSYSTCSPFVDSKFRQAVTTPAVLTQR